MRMAKTFAALAVFAVGSVALPVRAHENHALVVMTGTVVTADAGHIAIDTFDATAFTRKKLSVSLSEKTRFRIGNKRVDGLTLEAGQTVELIVQSEDTADGSLRYKAIQVRIAESKRR